MVSGLTELLSADLVPYVLLFLIAGVPAVFASKRWNVLAWPAAWIVFVMFVGLRHRIGGDWGNYVRKAEYVSDLSFMDAMGFSDPLFSALSWISSEFGFGVYGTNLAGAVIFCAGLFSYCARQPNRWLAISAATPFLVVASVMSASRQGIALGVFFLVVSYWKELSVKKRVFGLVVAGLLHSSAFLFLILTIVDMRISVIRKALLAAMVTLGTVWLMRISDTGLDQYARLYFSEQTINAPGAFFHLSLNLVPARAMLLSRKWWAKTVPNWTLLRILCLMAVVLTFMVPFFSQAVSRMSLYLFPVSITFFAYAPMMAKSPAGRAIVRLGSVTLLMTILVVWVGFSNQSFAYLPYQNVITTSFDDLDLR